MHARVCAHDRPGLWPAARCAESGSEKLINGAKMLLKCTQFECAHMVPNCSIIAKQPRGKPYRLKHFSPDDVNGAFGEEKQRLSLVSLVEKSNTRKCNRSAKNVCNQLENLFK